jgi:hypothetical protein
LCPLKELSVKERGWTLDVLRVVQSLGKQVFTNYDVYAFAPQLQELHPENRTVLPQIRKQLQILRERGLLLHVKPGLWAVK